MSEPGKYLMNNMGRVLLSSFLGFLLLGFGCGPTLPKISLPHFGSSGYLPADGFVGAWHVLGEKRWIVGNRLSDYVGRQATVFNNYGSATLATADYAKGNATEPVLTIESYEMQTALAASGVYYYHRGRILRGRGKPVDVGVEGVKSRRVLYFYKGRYFFKLIYTGKESKAPDLELLGKVIAKNMPGSARPPRGFEYLTVDGVDTKSSKITSGYTFNYEFLPPAIFCKAPGAGNIAEVFLMGHFSEDEAQKTGRDYRYFLEKNGLDYKFKRSGRKRLVWWARDATYGRVICSRFHSWVIGVLTPETYEKGEMIIDRVIERIQN